MTEPAHTASAMIPSRTRLSRNIRDALIFAAALAVLLIVAWLVYRPGLSGTFLFDDFGNLPAIGASGPVDNWATFWRYITSGSADPTGRPLTLLTFLIDARNWPADPWPFKHTNLCIHLLNAALLCWVMLRLGRHAHLSARHGAAAALAGSALWLLHPLLVSTTLYIVQREAMLPATFVLCGFLCWCTGRDRMDQDRIVAGWIWLLAGAWLCTVLAVLCKANGALLPLLIAVAEFTVLRGNAADPDKAMGAPGFRKPEVVILGLPILLLAVKLLAGIPADLHDAAINRPWTIGQRLLTEPRVVMDYLRLLWTPRATSYGLFNDQIQASTGWLHPWTTLPCVLAVIALIACGFALRRRHPFIAFALLFYFAGQVIESSFIPLELAFEHRNYLPSLFMFWPLAVWFTSPREPARALRLALLGVTVAVLASLTWSRSSVWGDQWQQALIWGKVNPDSPRAQSYAAAAEESLGKFGAAIHRLRAFAATHAPDQQIALNLADAECRTGAITPATWNMVLDTLGNTGSGATEIYTWFADAIPKAERHECKGLALATLKEALAAYRANPKLGIWPGRKQDIDHLAGLIALSAGDPREALGDFNRAVTAAPSSAAALTQAALLGSSGFPRLGLSHLDYAATLPVPEKRGFNMPKLHRWVLAKQHYWQDETNRLRATLTMDAARRAATTPQG
ncbi:MAG TPA: tetratricopeptide repeat protein [Rhodanobacteraceae bacterium]|nr:tetratricopeptide repeat protein [Rhodanobacteraceae bacterium]